MKTFKSILPPLLLSLSILCISCSKDNSSNPDSDFTNFIKTFDTGYFNLGMDLLEDENGDFVVAGYSKSEDGYIHPHVLKTDKEGQEIWSHLYESDINRHRLVFKILPVDGGFVYGGNKVDGVRADNQFFLTKIDDEGEIIWENFYGEYVSPALYPTFILCNDNSILMAGANLSYDTGFEPRIYLMMIDQNGNELWQDILEIYPYYTFDVCQSSDNGFVFVYGTDPLDGRVHVLKIDSDRNIVFQNNYGIEGINSIGYKISSTSDGGFAVTGTATQVNSRNVFMLKLDSNGFEEFFNVLDTEQLDLSFDIHETSDNRLIITGLSNHRKLFLVKTSYDGSVTWAREYEYREYTSGQGIIETSDGGFAVSGRTETTLTGSTDLYFMKTDPNGIVY